MNSCLVQSAEDGSLGIAMCACLPEAASGEFWGPTNTELKGTPRRLPRAKETKRCSQAAMDMLWEKSVAATGASPFGL